MFEKEYKVYLVVKEVGGFDGRITNYFGKAYVIEDDILMPACSAQEAKEKQCEMYKNALIEDGSEVRMKSKTSFIVKDSEGYYFWKAKSRGAVEC